MAVDITGNLSRYINRAFRGPDQRVGLVLGWVFERNTIEMYGLRPRGAGWSLSADAFAEWTEVEIGYEDAHAV